MSRPAPPDLRLRPAAETDAAAIARIYSHGIEDRVATFETRPRGADDVLALMRVEGGRYPHVVAEAPAAGVVGWASASAYRPRACYAGIAEFSIYVDREWRGRGVGRPLLETLVVAARDAGFWKLVSRVFAHNTASLALCRSCGFREVGTYERHAALEGAWTDVIIVERLIRENQH